MVWQANGRASAAKARTAAAFRCASWTRLRRLQALVGLRLAYQRVPLWVSQRVDGQIDIEVRPVQVMGTWQPASRRRSESVLHQPRGPDPETRPTADRRRPSLLPGNRRRVSYGFTSAFFGSHGR